MLLLPGFAWVAVTGAITAVAGFIRQNILFAKHDEVIANLSAKHDESMKAIANLSAKHDESMNRHDESMKAIANLSAKHDESMKAIAALSAVVQSNHEMLKDLYKKAHDAENSLDLAKKCSVRVQVSPSYQQNDKGSGTLVFIDERKYVLTNRHVIVKKSSESKCYRRIESVFRHGNDTIKTVPVVNALVSTVKDIDLALIPVDGDDAHNDSCYCTVTKKSLGLTTLSDRLVAVLPAQDESLEQVFTAEMRELDNTPLIGGTFGGTNGHSGLGYFASDTVVVVHRGKREYKGSKKGEFNSDEIGSTSSFGFDEYAVIGRHQDYLKECFQGIIHVTKDLHKQFLNELLQWAMVSFTGGETKPDYNGNHELTEYCVNNLTELIHVAARNPLAEAVDGSKAHELKNFRTIEELKYETECTEEG